VFAFRRETNPDAQRDFNQVHSYYFLATAGPTLPLVTVPADRRQRPGTRPGPPAGIIVTVTASDTAAREGHRSRVPSCVQIFGEPGY
jgi:hypothetical protein